MSQEKKHRDTRDFENALSDRSHRKYVFRLFVSGMTPKSLKAIKRTRQLCDEYLPGRYELEVVDIYQQPDKAKTEQIIAAPTLIKELPLPLRKFIGDLSNTERILLGLDIKEKATGGPGVETDGQ